MPNTPTVNPIVPLVPGLLRSLAIVGGDPALGYRGAAITSALVFIATAIERGVEARNEFDELNTLIEELAKSDKEPEKQTWYDFKARADAAESLFNPPPPKEDPPEEKDEPVEEESK